jgi:hypothetical protein
MRLRLSNADTENIEGGVVGDGGRVQNCETVGTGASLADESVRPELGLGSDGVSNVVDNVQWLRSECRHFERDMFETAVGCHTLLAGQQPSHCWE